MGARPPWRSTVSLEDQLLPGGSSWILAAPLNHKVIGNVRSPSSHNPLSLSFNAIIFIALGPLHPLSQLLLVSLHLMDTCIKLHLTNLFCRFINLTSIITLIPIIKLNLFCGSSTTIPLLALMINESTSLIKTGTSLFYLQVLTAHHSTEPATTEVTGWHLQAKSSSNRFISFVPFKILESIIHVFFNCVLAQLLPYHFLFYLL